MSRASLSVRSQRRNRAEHRALLSIAGRDVEIQHGEVREHLLQPSPLGQSRPGAAGLGLAVGLHGPRQHGLRAGAFRGAAGNALCIQEVSLFFLSPATRRIASYSGRGPPGKRRCGEEGRARRMLEERN